MGCLRIGRARICCSIVLHQFIINTNSTQLISRIQQCRLSQQNIRFPDVENCVLMRLDTDQILFTLKTIFFKLKKLLSLYFTVVEANYSVRLASYIPFYAVFSNPLIDKQHRLMIRLTKAKKTMSVNRRRILYIYILSIDFETSIQSHNYINTKCQDKNE